MKLKEKLTEALAHAAITPEDIAWINQDVQDYVAGRYIECSFLQDVAIFLDKVSMSHDAGGFLPIEAQNMAKRVRDNLIKSEFHGAHDALLKALEAE